MEKSQRYKQIIELVLAVRRRQHTSSRWIAEQTLKLLQQCIKESKTLADIKNDITEVCEKLMSSVPFTVVVKNICQRIINLMNEELAKTNEEQCTYDVKRSKSFSVIDYLLKPNHFTEIDGNAQTVKDALLNFINDMFKELETAYSEMSDYAIDYIHQNDVVLTVGYSQSVFCFIKKAAKLAKFSVLVTEHAPFYDGIQMVNKLREVPNVSASVISDSAVFAVMPIITSVICSCRAVFADASFITASFIQSVALAARHYAKPVIALYLKIKLTESFMTPNYSYAVLSSPLDIYSSTGDFPDNLTILVPDGDLLHFSDASIFINEDGPHIQNEVFTQVQNIYNPND